MKLSITLAVMFFLVSCSNNERRAQQQDAQYTTASYVEIIGEDGKETYTKFGLRRIAPPGEDTIEGLTVLYTKADGQKNYKKFGVYRKDPINEKVDLYIKTIGGDGKEVYTKSDGKRFISSEKTNTTEGLISLYIKKIKYDRKVVYTKCGGFLPEKENSKFSYDKTHMGFNMDRPVIPNGEPDPKMFNTDRPIIPDDAPQNDNKQEKKN